MKPSAFADALTYGAFFALSDVDRYTVVLTIRRPKRPGPVIARFDNGHVPP